MRCLIIGCGYVGLRTAQDLIQQGHAVTGWVRSYRSAEAVEAVGASVYCADASEPAAWKEVGGSWDVIFFTASTSGGGESDYRAIHDVALGQAIAHAGSALLLYTSSTSVYGQTDESWVDEEASTELASATARILVEAEQRVLAKRGVVLRLAGIYGPGRALYLRKLREGQAEMPGGGLRWVNQIHRDDAAKALIWALKNRPQGQVFNVCDNEPVRLADLYAWLCQKTGLPLPPSVLEPLSRKRGLTNKRVSNRRLRWAGWSPIYPTFREGYGSILADPTANPTGS